MGKLKNKNIAFWFKSLIFLVAAFSLAYMLQKNEHLDEVYQAEFLKGWKVHSWLIVLSVLLIPVNWSLEAYKWKYLIRRIERISFWKALEGVVSGVTMGFITPHSLGDYAARILTLTGQERTKGIGAVFVSRISQFYITLYFGSIALILYLYYVVQAGELNYRLITGITIFANIFFILMYGYHKQLLKVLERWPFLRKMLSYFHIIKEYSFAELNFALLLSLGRYVVFCFQFVLILIVFGISLPWWILLTGVAFIFFVKSVIPTFLDLGVRETAAVFFFGVFGYDHQNIIFASLTLWLMNLVLPALTGLLLVHRIRLFNRG